MSFTRLSRAAMIGAVLSACAAGSAAAEITFKIVKKSAGMATTRPTLELLSNADDWQTNLKETFSGENPREVYFTVESKSASAKMPQVAINAPGVQPMRAIVGKTDVPFESSDGRTTFTLVPDFASSQLIVQRVTADPDGGVPINFFHNSPLRSEGPYSGKPYPDIESRAQNNYLIAARETFKLMGINSRQQPFAGNVVLNGFEAACSRAHQDYPPHFHIMLWLRAGEGEVPHLYIGRDGKLTGNHFMITEIPQTPERRQYIAERKKAGGSYGLGKTCHVLDPNGKPAWDLTITPEGGVLMGRAGDEYLIIGDASSAAGAADAVLVKKDGQTLRRIQVTDDTELGVTKVVIERHENGATARLVQQYRYDPFTGLTKTR